MDDGGMDWSTRVAGVRGAGKVVEGWRDTRERAMERTAATQRETRAGGARTMKGEQATQTGGAGTWGEQVGAGSRSDRGWQARCRYVQV